MTELKYINGQAIQAKKAEVRQATGQEITTKQAIRKLQQDGYKLRQ
ncbi:hypothetical protein [Geminocystis sp. NIES-3709]|nr:hypothetical protein [Geminocystis sp. NIES-3709]BAQ67076.1 hypothetical protein GM3709_3841 [Geminocystis sp. NIES-3709]